MTRKKKTLMEQISEETKEIRRKIAHWETLLEVGGQDPFRPDGVNMNLVRKHVIYSKRQLEELCAEAGVDLPEEYYLPIPPKVQDGYMADMNGERAENLAKSFFLTGRKPKKYPEQGARW